MTRPRATVEMLTGPDRGEIFEFARDRLTFGRHDTNEVRLEAKNISRNHAKITYRDGAFVLTDLGSKNRTRLNGDPVTESDLSDGDEIQVGPFRMRFHLAKVSASAKKRSSAAAAETDGDDGTQFVDMENLLGKRRQRKEETNTDVAPVARRAAPPPGDETTDGEGEGTDLIDVGSFLARSQGSPAKRSRAKSAPGPTPPTAPQVSVPAASSRNTPENIRFARTAEGGNVEEGTDLLNMEEVLGEPAPRIREIRPGQLGLVAGALGVVVLAVMLVYQMFFVVKHSRQDQALVAGESQVLSLAIPPDNQFLKGGDPQEAVQKPDPDLLVIERFLITYHPEQKRLHYHYVLAPTFHGRTSMVLEYENGNLLEIVFDIHEKKVDTITAPPGDVLAMVAQKIHEARDKIASSQREPVNLTDAWEAYSEAMRLLSQLKLGTFKPEYREAKLGLEEVEHLMDEAREEMEKNYDLFMRRDEFERAIEVLGQMIRVRRGEHDEEYLRRKKELEAYQNGGIPKYRKYSR